MWQNFFKERVSEQVLDRARIALAFVLVFTIGVLGTSLYFKKPLYCLNNYEELRTDNERVRQLLVESEAQKQELVEQVSTLQSNIPVLTAGATEAIGGRISINQATGEQLDTLPGIGPVYAQRIIEYREAHGGFKSLNELMEIKGIGEKTFEKLVDKISL